MNFLSGIVIVHYVSMLSLGSLVLQQYKALMPNRQAFSSADTLPSPDALSCTNGLFTVEPSRSIRE